MKKLLVFLVVLMFSASFVFAEGQSEKDKEVTTIRWVGVQHVWTDVMLKYLPEFEAETGIKVQFESYTEEQLSNKLTVESTAGSKNLDVYMFRPLQQGLIFANNGWSQPLNSYYAGDSEYDINDISPAALGTCTVEGNVIAIPLITEAEVLYYNKLMFAEKGLEPPKTQTEMMEVAAKLTDRDNGVYGVVSRGARSASVTQFSSYLYSNGGNYMTDGKASLTTPEAIKTYKFYGDMLRNYGPPGVLNMSWPQAADIFSQGKVGMYTDASSLYNAVADPEKSKIAGNVGVALLPSGDHGSKPYNVCAWGISVGVNSDKKDAAWKLVRWLTSKENMARAQKEGNSMSRISSWDDPANNTAFTEDFVKVVQESSAIGTPADRPVVIHVQEARDIIGTVIVAGIMGENVEKVAEQAQKDFQKLIDSE